MTQHPGGDVGSLVGGSRRLARAHSRVPAVAWLSQNAGLAGYCCLTFWASETSVKP